MGRSRNRTHEALVMVTIIDHKTMVLVLLIFGFVTSIEISDQGLSGVDNGNLINPY